LVEHRSSRSPALWKKYCAKLRIPQQDYPNRDAAHEFIQELRSRYKDGDPIKGDDHLFVLELFKLNPLYREKLGWRKISHFMLGLRGHPTRSFINVFTDGTSIDFSFWKATERLFAQTFRPPRSRHPNAIS
jgi:hypothetical protein